MLGKNKPQVGTVTDPAFFVLTLAFPEPLNMSPLSSSVVEVNVSAPTARWPDGVQTKCRNEPALPPGTPLPLCSSGLCSLPGFGARCFFSLLS